MASNSSGALSPSKTYKLGDYTFRLVVTYLPDENITSVQCHASNGTSNKQTGKDFPGHVNVLNWNVEANERTADVYFSTDSVTIQTNTTTGSTFAHLTNTSYDRYFTRIGIGDSYATTWVSPAGYTCPLVFSTVNTGVWYHCDDVRSPSYTHDCRESTTIVAHNKTFYYQNIWGIIQGRSPDPRTVREVLESIIVHNKERNLIARFEINVQDADGGNWDYPADTGEPSKTLHITVTGALSGRHNDPLNDTSYHYTPSDREQADVYGSGGVGGNGGAGGGGASTVIIYNCATDKAGYTEEIAIARRHGYGSGAGKGGKGGDGCILVYY